MALSTLTSAASEAPLPLVVGARKAVMAMALEEQ